MFSAILKRLGRILDQERLPDSPSTEGQLLSGVLEKDVALLASTLPSQSDTNVRTLEVPILGGHARLALIYIESLNKPTVISETVLKPLLQMQEQSSTAISDLPHIIKNRMLAVGNVEQTRNTASLIDAIMKGDTALLIDGSNTALLLLTRSPEIRPVEAETEVGVRGSREGFTEILRTNMSQIRRRLRDPALTFEILRVGTKTKTDVAIAYIEGLTGEALISEVRSRLSRIDTTAILESGYIEQFNEESHWSPFSTVANSERPDAVTAKLLEGKLAIMVDGTPTTLTVPMSFVESFHHPEDYFSRPFYVTMVRMVRIVSFFFALAGPAVYIALVSFHQEILPTTLLVTIAAAAEGTPFPAYLEIVLMGVVFEILREAALRMPRAIGQAVSIVGTLVIGQAAIEAGIVGAPVVIVIALAALATFVVLPQTDSISIIRLVLVGASAVAGLYGVLIVFLFMLIHLCALRSFGVPFLEPLGPLRPKGLKDVILRYPLKNLKEENTNQNQN